MLPMISILLFMDSDTDSSSSSDNENHNEPELSVERQSAKRLCNDPLIFFDVRGKIFKVSRSTILAKPDTLLAHMITNAELSAKAVMGRSADNALYVDANSDIFELILDFYRRAELRL